MRIGHWSIAGVVGTSSGTQRANMAEVQISASWYGSDDGEQGTCTVGGLGARVQYQRGTSKASAGRPRAGAVPAAGQSRHRVSHTAGIPRRPDKRIRRCAIERARRSVMRALAVGRMMNAVSPMTEPTCGCTCSRQIVVSQTTAAARRGGRPRRASRGERRVCLAVLLWGPSFAPWLASRAAVARVPAAKVEAARAVREPETPSPADSHKVPLPDSIDTVTLWRAQRARWPMLFFLGSLLTPFSQACHSLPAPCHPRPLNGGASPGWRTSRPFASCQPGRRWLRNAIVASLPLMNLVSVSTTTDATLAHRRTLHAGFPANVKYFSPGHLPTQLCPSSPSSATRSTSCFTTHLPSLVSRGSARFLSCFFAFGVHGYRRMVNQWHTSLAPTPLRTYLGSRAALGRRPPADAFPCALVRFQVSNGEITDAAHVEAPRGSASFHSRRVFRVRRSSLHPPLGCVRVHALLSLYVTARDRLVSGRREREYTRFFPMPPPPPSFSSAPRQATAVNPQYTRGKNQRTSRELRAAPQPRSRHPWTRSRDASSAIPGQQRKKWQRTTGGGAESLHKSRVSPRSPVRLN